MLDRIANQQTQELDTRVLSMTALLEPLLILVMGGVVLLIVLAILMPIFEMNQMVRLTDTLSAAVNPGIDSWD